MIRAISENGDESNWCKLERGELIPEDFEKHFALELEKICGQPCRNRVSTDQISVFLSQSKLKKRTSGLVDFIERELSVPIEDTLETIESLKKLNIPIALLTNNWFIEKGI